jgi:NAD(P)-dependent dehydrogenase (short-subunit alcohol dehydrogenase family)
MASKPVALVTGASSGIGQATAELLAAHGFTVFGASRTAFEDERSYTWLPLDVRSDASAEAVVQSVMEHAGRIDVLVNNAGYGLFGAIEETSIADAQAQLDTNLFGVMRMVKAVLPVMRQQGSGRIINVSSVIGQVAVPYAGLYATSKFALEGLSEALREEVRQFGIEVALIEPGFVKTSFVSKPPTAPIDAYTAGRQVAQQALRAGVTNGMEPGTVAQIIVRAATARPRLRYAVGSNIKTLLLMKRLLPEARFDGVRRRVFRSGSAPAGQAQRQPQNTAATR